ncbi:MAG: 30S ribosomal protein S3 [Patescibacteria group bacterium]
MGNKVHPKVFRLAINKHWGGLWFSKSNFSKFLQEDVRIREYLLKKLRDALVDRIEIERSRGTISIFIYSAKPGVIIGRAGAGIEELNKSIRTEFYRGKRVDLKVNVKEVQKPSLSARIVGLQAVFDIEKRMPYRRTMKQAIDRVLKAGAEGIKITIAGRLNGAEIARSESLASGKVPLHNLRADIDFASVTARTIYGAIGVKVWINRGEVFDQTQNLDEQNQEQK